MQNCYWKAKLKGIEDDGGDQELFTSFNFEMVDYDSIPSSQVGGASKIFISSLN